MITRLLELPQLRISSSVKHGRRIPTSTPWPLPKSWSYRASVLSWHLLGMLLYFVEYRWHYKTISREGSQSGCGNSSPFEHMPSHCTRVRLTSHNMRMLVKSNTWTNGSVCIQGYIKNSPWHRINTKFPFVFVSKGWYVWWNYCDLQRAKQEWHARSW